jgi:anti-sigma factor RsiW
VNACRDFDLLLPLHAAGALDAAEAARVEAHLASCAICRAEAAADAEALALAKLPPPSEAERRALADVPRRALAELHRSDRRRSGWKRAAVAIAVAAAVLLAVLSPAVLQRTPQVPAAAAVWQEPDLDTMWEDAGVLDLEASETESDELDTDAVLAAVEL